MTLLLLLSSVAMAQTYQEVVYLKNGSIIRGTIIEQVPERTIKIQTADGSVFVYQMSEVEKITKEIPAKPKIEESGGSFHWDTTQVYGGFVRGGIALSSGMYSGATLAVFEFLNSISVSKGIYIGAAIGYESVGSLELIPLTLATRVSLGSSNTQPYILANGGIELSAPGGFRNI